MTLDKLLPFPQFSIQLNRNVSHIFHKHVIHSPDPSSRSETLVSVLAPTPQLLGALIGHGFQVNEFLEASSLCPRELSLRRLDSLSRVSLHPAAG